ncbi:MAG: hypothetical protein PHI40_01085 [Caldisericia bacterium]|nr:hypothetical protein [Caldisericia bacterium]
MQKKLQCCNQFFLRRAIVCSGILFCFFSLFTLWDCSLLSQKDSFFSQEMFSPSMVFFANPEGFGIRVYQPENGKVQALTEDNDDFPYYSPDQHRLYFLRRKDTLNPSTQKTNTTFHVCSLDLHRGSTRYISEITIYTPRKDRKDQIFFVDQGRKIVVSPLNSYPFIVDTETGQKMPHENVWTYYSQINQYDLKGNRLFGTTNTDPYNPYFQDVKHIHEMLPQKTLFWWEEGRSIETIQTMEGPDSYERWFFGLAWSASSNALYFSQDSILYMWDGLQCNTISQGVHPFTVKESFCAKEACSFPFFRLYSWIPLENDNEYLFAENNRMALYQDNEFHTINNSEFLGGQTKEEDPYYLFDHLVLLGELVYPDHTYILVSTQKTENVTPETIAKGNQKPDIIKIFNFHPTEIDGTIDHSLFFSNGSWDLTFQMQFLASPPQPYPEIILRYTASNFEGKERMQAAGRAIQWLDVYSYDPEQDMYVQANMKFPSLFKDIKERLEDVYELVIQSKRASNPLMCEEDIRILETKIREARSISRSN